LHNSGAARREIAEAYTEIERRHCEGDVPGLDRNSKSFSKRLRQGGVALAAIIVFFSAELNEVAIKMGPPPASAGDVISTKGAVIRDYDAAEPFSVFRLWNSHHGVALSNPVRENRNGFGEHSLRKIGPETVASFFRGHDRFYDQGMIFINIDKPYIRTSEPYPDRNIVDDGGRFPIISNRVSNEGFALLNASLQVLDTKSEHIGPLDFGKGVTRDFGLRNGGNCGATGRSRRDSCILHTLTHVAELPDEQSGLQDSYAEQRNGEGGEPIRIIRDPLRLESEFLVNYRFIPALVVLLVGLFFGVLSGQYFYRERYLVGAALVGCGWLCALLGLGGWF
jgi:hypothetical protein